MSAETAATTAPAAEKAQDAAPASAPAPANGEETADTGEKRKAEDAPADAEEKK